MSKRTTWYRLIVRFIFILCCCIFASSIYGPTVFAMTEADQYSIQDNTPFYNPSACTTNDGSDSTPTNVTTSQEQTAVVQTIIGIDKTLNLGTEGALVGLMTADGESGFTVYANSNVPISLQIAHTAVGDNHDSVGVFQQQPQDDWSTVATGPAALTNESAVAQDMDPAFSAEAFFGLPSTETVNAPNPEALKHGLQDINNWQSLSPAQAATQVQGDLNGAASYAPFQGAAQNLINQYYNSSPAVALPVSVTGTSGAGGSTSSTLPDSCDNISTTTGTAGCANPLRGITALTPERIDQGVDYGGGGVIYAICGPGTITNLTNAGWNFGGYDAFIVEHVTGGAANGKNIYVAEDCVPMVTIGEQVTDQTKLCDINNPPPSTGIETGWANSTGVTAESQMTEAGSINGASTCIENDIPTLIGINYNQFIVSVGGTSGLYETPGTCGLLPSGWPQWCPGKNYECQNGANP